MAFNKGPCLFVYVCHLGCDPHFIKAKIIKGFFKGAMKALGIIPHVKGSCFWKPAFHIFSIDPVADIKVFFFSGKNQGLKAFTPSRVETAYVFKIIGRPDYNSVQVFFFHQKKSLFIFKRSNMGGHLEIKRRQFLLNYFSTAGIESIRPGGWLPKIHKT